jgi:glycine/D-amino acid oxidase-like deaminating enzyme
MHPEFVIVGQGLAGTALAWALLRRGRGVLVVDDDRGGASRLAAGLITPVTGKRLAKSWRWDELYPAAVAFYRTIEVETGAHFFHQRQAVRLFADEAERDEYHRREPNVLRDLVRPAEHINGDWFDAPLGGFEMPGAARLDVPHYLDVSREHFRARGAFLPLTSPLEGRGQEKTVIFCRGFGADAEPWFGGIRFNAAKGEVLTVRIPALAEERVVHRGIWLAAIGTRGLSPAKPGAPNIPTVAAPSGSGVFRVGSTYCWEPLDANPTPEGRAEIESKLRAFLKLPYEVIDHRAAVRPVIDAGYPVLGRHPEHPHLAYFNGLGSKGSLLAPFFANQLAAHLCGAGEIEGAVNVRKYLCPG